MKFNVALFLSLNVLCSCSNELKQQKIEISGVIYGTFPEKIFLFFEDQYKQRDSISAPIIDGRFTFYLQVKTPILGRLYLLGNSYISDFYIDQPKLSLYCSNKIRVTNLTDSMNVLNIDSIPGSPTDISRRTYELLNKNVSLNPNDTLIHSQYVKSIDSFTRKNPHAKLSAYIINQAAIVLNIQEYQPLLANLDSSLKSSYEWTLAYQSLNELKKSSENLTESGMPFLNVNLPNLSGEVVAIDSLKGKCFVVVCWASWCVPCRRENPLLNSLHAKYSARGLQIIGISFDSDISKWKKAITQDHLQWPQVIDKQGFEGTLSSYYGIQAIPALFILDREKRFVGESDTFKDLEEEIKSVLESKP